MLTVSEQLIGGTVQKRQTVMSGPNVSGVPNFLPSTSVSLSLTSQNITSTDPLIITSANGFFLDGAQKNSTGSSISNLTWSGLTASNTNYLYVTIAGGTLTPLETILPPIYQFGGTPSITSGQFTFNISEMRGYLGNGSTAPQSNVVFVGEAVCGGSTVTSTIAYAYNGIYRSDEILLSLSTTYSFSHNIGVVPINLAFEGWVRDVDNGYVLPYHVTSNFDYNTLYNNFAMANTAEEKNIFKVRTSSTSTINYIRPSDGLQLTVTVANKAGLTLIIKRIF